MADEDVQGTNIDDQTPAPRKWGKKAEAEPVEAEDTVVDDVVEEAPTSFRDRFKPRQVIKPPTKIKVDAAEAESRLSGLGKPKVMRRMGIAACVLVMLGSIGYQVMETDSYQTQVKQNATTIKNLQESMKSTQAKAEQVSNPDAVTKNVADAQAAGADVARIQNVYLTIGSTSSPTGAEKLKANAAEMDRWLAPQADGKASPARSPWAAPPEEPGVSGTAGVYSWVFVLAAPSPEAMEKVELLWQFRKPTGEIAGWATGMYDSKSKKISQMAYGRSMAAVPPPTDDSKVQTQASPTVEPPSTAPTSNPTANPGHREIDENAKPTTIPTGR